MRSIARPLGVAAALLCIGVSVGRAGSGTPAPPLLAFVRSGVHACDFPPDGSLNPPLNVVGGGPSCAPPPHNVPLDRDEIYLMRRNGRALRRLAPGIEPSWSPDGQSLAYVRSSRILVVARAAGGQRRSITVDPTGQIEWPTWSPDGRQIVFSELQTSALPVSEQLFVVGSDGTGLRRLTTTIENDHSPAFTPDGRRIAYAHWGVKPGIWLVNRDGGNPHQLVALRGWAFGLGWSPTGDTLAFGLVNEPFGAAKSDGVYLVNRDGSGLHRLVAAGRTDLTSVTIDRPAWTPDGKQITYSTGRLYAISARGGKSRLVATAPWPIYQPAWQPKP